MKIAIKEASLLLLIALALAGATKLVYPAPKPPPRDEFALSVSDALQKPPPVLWIDARSKALFEKDHIADAILLNEDAWEELLPQFLERYAPDQTIIVYCDSQWCDASRQVAKRLREEVGIQNVLTLEGGWQAWQAARKQ